MPFRPTVRPYQPGPREVLDPILRALEDADRSMRERSDAKRRRERQDRLDARQQRIDAQRDATVRSGFEDDDRYTTTRPDGDYLPGTLPRESERFDTEADPLEGAELPGAGRGRRRGGAFAGAELPGVGRERPSVRPADAGAVPEMDGDVARQHEPTPGAFRRDPGRDLRADPSLTREPGEPADFASMLESELAPEGTGEPVALPGQYVRELGDYTDRPIFRPRASVGRMRGFSGERAEVDPAFSVPAVAEGGESFDVYPDPTHVTPEQERMRGEFEAGQKRNELADLLEDIGYSEPGADFIARGGPAGAVPKPRPGTARGLPDFEVERITNAIEAVEGVLLRDYEGDLAVRNRAIRDVLRAHNYGSMDEFDEDVARLRAAGRGETAAESPGPTREATATARRVADAVGGVGEAIRRYEAAGELSDRDQAVLAALRRMER